jgi:hypothetical protein
LAAIGLLAALAVGILGLSPDGARLRRLRGDSEALVQDDALFSPAGYGPENAAPAKALERDAVREQAGGGAVGEVDEGALRLPRSPRDHDSHEGGDREDRLGFSQRDSSAEGGDVVDLPDVVEKPAADHSTGSIRVELMGSNEQVEVLLDGESKGPTPLLLCRISPGPHKLTFVRDGRSWDEEVTISAGDTTLAVCSLYDQPAP